MTNYIDQWGPQMKQTLQQIAATVGPKEFARRIARGLAMRERLQRERWADAYVCEEIRQRMKIGVSFKDAVAVVVQMLAARYDHDPQEIREAVLAAWEAPQEARGPTPEPKTP